MNKEFLPFALPDIGEEEIEAVVKSMRSGWVTTGPKTREFEQEFAKYLGGGVEAIAVNSATAGLHLALEACGIKPGDEVIVPTLTFTASAEIVRYLGAHPIFVDCDSSLCIDVCQIEAKINKKTRAIIPVHMAGLACDMDAILALAKRYDLKVIEDAAHSLPTKLGNVLIGQHSSDAIVYSFYATKTITTGEGGMLVSRNPEIIRRAKIMRLHGMSKDAFDRYTSTTPTWYYEIVAPGFKYNLTDIASSIGLCQLTKIDKFHKRRTELAECYLTHLSHLDLIMPPQVKNPQCDTHAWHLFCIELNHARLTRDEFILELSNHGIGTSVHFIPLHKQPYWRETYSLKDEDFPIANNYFKHAVSLPLYTKMTNLDQMRVINTIKELLT